MEEDKNIQLTIVRPDAYRNEIVIDLFDLFDFMKRLFTTWVAVSVAVFAILGGFSTLLWSPAESDVVAVIRYNTGSGLLGSNRPDIEKLTSASVVTAALESLEMPLSNMDSIRTHLSIEGILPDSTVDRQTLYYGIYLKNTETAMDAAEKMLSMDYSSDRYLLRFDCSDFSRQDGVKILNALIDAYQQYFIDTYTSRPLLGSMTNVIDYQNYDYAESVEVFSQQLNSITSFLSQYTGSAFRSSITGYTVEDLIRLAQNIRNVKLDRMSAMIWTDNIYKGSLDDVLSRYEWQIQQTEEQIAVLEGRQNSLNTALQNYQKDPLIYLVNETGVSKAPGGELNNVYDDLLTQLLNTQNDISNQNSTKERYETLIARRTAEDSTAKPEQFAQIEQSLAQMNGEINTLIQLINTTMDDYFFTTRSNLLSIQMSALVESTDVNSSLSSLVKKIILVEVLVFMLFGGIAFAFTLAKAREDARAWSSAKQQSARAAVRQTAQMSGQSG